MEVSCGVRHTRSVNEFMLRSSDNPESDIAGANAARWKSILVRTGVYDPRQGPPSHRPTHEVEDVEQAVQWALEQEFQP